MIYIIKHNRPVKVREFKKRGILYHLCKLINKIKKNEIGEVEIKWEI